MSPDDYYAYDARIVLERHVAIYGLIASETRVVGQRAAALCGVGWHDTTRLVEHARGRDFEALVADLGEAEVRRAEAKALERAVGSRPCGVITLGDGALLDPESLRLAVGRTTLIALALDLEAFFWRLRSSPPRDIQGEPYPRPEKIGDVRVFHEQRAAALGAAHHRLPAAGRSPERLARDLAGWLLETTEGPPRPAG